MLERGSLIVVAHCQLVNMLTYMSETDVLHEDVGIQEKLLAIACRTERCSKEDS